MSEEYCEKYREHLKICKYKDRIVARALDDISLEEALKVVADFYNENPFNNLRIKEGVEMVVMNGRGKPIGYTLTKEGIRKVDAFVSFGLVHVLERVEEEILEEGSELVLIGVHGYED